MKPHLLLGVLALGGWLSVVAQNSEAEEPYAPRWSEYDADQDGHLSPGERRAYWQALLEYRREKQRGAAMNRPFLTAQMKQLIEPEIWTEAKKAQYDLNQNGILEPHERGRERLDAMQAAQERFRKLDTNGDGRLDAQERRAAGLPALPADPAPAAGGLPPGPSSQQP